MKSTPLRIALLGHGSVGREVARALRERAPELKARIGARIEVTGIAVRTPRTAPDTGTPTELFTLDAGALVRRGDNDVVVELIGGIEPARSLTAAALESGASVVTGNKALIAAHGSQLHELACKFGVDLAYEAAVAGAVPLLRPLRQSLAGDRVRRVTGIVNGTTNFILDRMTREGGTFRAALGEAQRRGYAEADPSADVSGADAAAKMAILARFAFRTELDAEDVLHEGITHLGPADIAQAETGGHVLKLIGICDRTEDGVSARVHPMLLPRAHPLADIDGAYNGLLVEAESAGQLMFRGLGAGGPATASAVLGDLVEVCRNRLSGAAGGHVPSDRLPVRGADTIAHRHQVRLLVADRPGVLSEVTTVFARHGVSLAAVRQEGLGTEAQLVLATHRAPQAGIDAVVAGLRGLGSVRGDIRTLRILDGPAG